MCWRQSAAIHTSFSGMGWPALRNSSRRLGAWDRGLIDVMTAWIRADLVTSHAAVKSLMRVVPNSEFAVVVAHDAIALGRAGEAVR